MYAVIKTGGKQYQVAPGDILRVEKLAGEVGDTVEFSEVLFVSDDDEVKIGRPLVDGARVTATIRRQDKARKVLVFKKKRRKGYRVLRGHRQPYTALEIKAINS